VIPLSCVNCCHNPLQLGQLGTAFGYCTRHRAVLNHPQLTTCGQLLRKDLLAESATRQQAIHRQSYVDEFVVMVSKPGTHAAAPELVEKANGQLPADPVIEEAQNYGGVDSKIASMAALHRIPGARAEVARLSLSRAYFRNCRNRGGAWTAGVHLLHWTLARLDDDPSIDATDLRGPIAFSLGHTIAVARWTVIAFRLAFVSDVARAAKAESDRAGALATLAGKAMNAAPGTDPDRLLTWLREKRPTWSAALTPHRYAALREKLRRDDADEA
jgi:hypothetical protein